MNTKLLRVFGVLLASSPVVAIIGATTYTFGWAGVQTLGIVLAAFCVFTAGMAALYLADEKDRIASKSRRRGLKRK